MVRIQTKVVMVGNLPLGGGHPVRLQSMTSVPTVNTTATVAQAIRIFEAGADLVRVSVPDKASVPALKVIKKELNAAGFSNPLVADVHFEPKLAIQAARYVEKVRINPGNFGSSLTNLKALESLVKVCKDHGTVIRIGTNMGSLPAGFLKTYGHTPEAMVESTMSFLQMLEDLGHSQTIISLKASQVKSMVKSNILMIRRMSETGTIYPLHIGLTEAGNGLAGRIKSAAGIGPLLSMGIGDTIRVSLTEDPENEIPVSEMIIAYARNSQVAPNTSYDYVYDTSNEETLAIMAAIDAGSSILDIKAEITGTQSVKEQNSGNIRISAPNIKQQEIVESIRQWVLHATGKPSLCTDYIACPACARSSADLEALLNATKNIIGDVAGLKIAVMGCVVNGPGEMADAHYGLLATSKGRIWLYKGGHVIDKDLDQESAPLALCRALQRDGWTVNT